MDVLRIAQILSETIHVHVILVIIWEVMDICVMVSTMTVEPPKKAFE